MKRTLLLLALLVTGELGFQTTEACAPYFEAYITMVLGDKTMINSLIMQFNPTDGEREALDKIQECFNEAGLKEKVMDGYFLYHILISPECRKYYSKDTITKILGILEPIWGNN